MEMRKLEGIIEAILFTMGGAVELSRIAKAVEEPEERIKEAVLQCGSNTHKPRVLCTSGRNLPVQ